MLAKKPGANFTTELRERLDSLAITQAVRRTKYGDIANQWPIGWTPPDIVQKRMNDVAKLMALFQDSQSSSGSTTPTSTYSPQPTPGPEETKAATRTGERGGSKVSNCHTSATMDGRERIVQETGYAEETLPKMLRGKKRRRGYNLGDEGQEAERPAKIRTAAATTIKRNTGETTTIKPGTTALKSKRRRNFDAEGEEKESKQSAKLRVISPNKIGDGTAVARSGPEAKWERKQKHPGVSISCPTKEQDKRRPTYARNRIKYVSPSADRLRKRTRVSQTT